MLEMKRTNPIEQHPYKALIIGLIITLMICGILGYAVGYYMTNDLANSCIERGSHCGFNIFTTPFYFITG